MRLNEANGKLRAYAIEVEHMAETRERNRLAREIHDTLGHALTSIMAGIDACMATVIQLRFTKQQLPKIREAAKHGIMDVRRSVRKLRPDDLEQLSPQQAWGRWWKLCRGLRYGDRFSADGMAAESAGGRGRSHLSRCAGGNHQRQSPWARYAVND